MAQDTLRAGGHGSGRQSNRQRGAQLGYGENLYVRFMDELRDVGEMQNRTAVILERMQGMLNQHADDIRELKQRDRAEDQREWERNKQAPESMRGWIQTLVSLCGLACSLAAVIIATVHH